VIKVVVGIGVSTVGVGVEVICVLVVGLIVVKLRRRVLSW